MLNRLSTLEYETMITRCLLFICILAAHAVDAEDVAQQSECDKIKQKIRHIQSRMRAGYTRAQGEKLEAELRRLRALRQKACRR
jgi:F0F1-type ATP synthase epsilon subunit